jgi:hypothetical protein
MKVSMFKLLAMVIDKTNEIDALASVDPVSINDSSCTHVFESIV